ncbi:MAG: hypothetical protein ACKVWR_07830 [Acidimicrobiales bacterium]
MQSVKNRALGWEDLAELHHRWRRELPADSAVHLFIKHVIALGAMRQDDREGAARAALVALRPVRRPVAPPVELWLAFQAEVAGLDESPADLAVAFGLGWRRQLGADAWDQRWPLAFVELIRLVRTCLWETAAGLAAIAPHAALSEDDLLELPSLFAMALTGSCDCGHHVQACRRGAERCAAECCYERHELRRWQPSRCHLRSFVDEAIRGSAQKGIRGGWFSDSMLYRVLAEDSRLLRRKVEHCRCDSCGCLFEGAHCPDCDAPITPGTRREARGNWLVTPASHGGDHHELVRWQCGECANLWPSYDGNGCPRCGWRPAAGKSPGRVTVWVRTDLAGGVES